MASATVSAVPKYRHHKGTGQAFVQIQGRRHYLGKWDSPKSKERYAAFVAELAVRPIAAFPSPLAGTAGDTVVELADAYRDFAQGYYRKGRHAQSVGSTISSLMLDKLLARLYGTEPRPPTSAPKLFKAIRQTLIDAGHSRAYINKLVPILTRVFKWAVRGRTRFPPASTRPSAPSKG